MKVQTDVVWGRVHFPDTNETWQLGKFSQEKIFEALLTTNQYENLVDSDYHGKTTKSRYDAAKAIKKQEEIKFGGSK
tara:strand:+ start:941 stop:1171 length:231 start_codon:yes stop_codon:yes gene_type:complete